MILAVCVSATTCAPAREAICAEGEKLLDTHPKLKDSQRRRRMKRGEVSGRSTSRWDAPRSGTPFGFGAKVRLRSGQGPGRNAERTEA